MPTYTLSSLINPPTASLDVHTQHYILIESTGELKDVRLKRIVEKCFPGRKCRGKSPANGRTRKGFSPCHGSIRGDGACDHRASR
jgi:hypothetical protein